MSDESEEEAQSPGPPRIGDMLVAAGLITEAQLELALTWQEETGHRLGEMLVRMGAIDELQLTQILSNQLTLPWVNLRHVRFDEDLLDLVPGELAERYELMPIYIRRVRRQGETLYLAMVDPTNDEAIDAIQGITGMPIKVMVAPPTDIRNAIREHYLDLPPLDPPLHEEASRESSELEALSGSGAERSEERSDELSEEELRAAGLGSSVLARQRSERPAAGAAEASSGGMDLDLEEALAEAEGEDSAGELEESSEGPIVEISYDEEGEETEEEEEGPDEPDEEEEDDQELEAILAEERRAALAQEDTLGVFAEEVGALPSRTEEMDAFVEEGFPVDEEGVPQPNPHDAITVEIPARHEPDRLRPRREPTPAEPLLRRPPTVAEKIISEPPPSQRPTRPVLRAASRVPSRRASEPAPEPTSEPASEPASRPASQPVRKPREARREARRKAPTPNFLSFTFLDGTEVRLPTPHRPIPVPEAKPELHAEDLIKALRARAAGAPLSPDPLAEGGVERLLASLLGLMLKKGLLQDKELIEAWEALGDEPTER